MELSAHRDELEVWREVRAGLRAALGESMYSVWIDPVSLRRVEGKTLVLGAPPAIQAWLGKRYARVLERCVKAVLGDGARVVFTGTGDTRDTNEATELNPGPQAGAEIAGGALNPRYTFDQFIIGDSNQLAHAAALTVAELPGQAYNPLFLHAPPGLGKTHLLHAIGNYIIESGAGTRVRYTTVETFTNHFIRSLGARSLDRFKQAYRELDVLLIDDVQFLASKVKTEEEFFHTFNALYDNGRQLVLTCDRLPGELEGVTRRLRERFQAGLVADMQPPNFGTRVAILRKRAALDNVPLAEPGVLELIAERVSSNVRTLEGALIRVVAYHSLSRQPIDLELTRRVLDGMHYPSPAGGGHSAGRGATPSPASLEAVKAAVAEHFGISVAELVSPSRAARVAWPRQLAIHLARELTGAPLATIGQAFGGRNHATVLHACKRVIQRASEDQQAAVDIDELKRALRENVGDRHG